MENKKDIYTGKFFKKDKEGNDEVIHEVQLEFDKKKEMYYRPGTSDRTMLKESLKDYPTVEHEGKIILDLGSNIGGFAKIALQNGCKQVIAYEPDDFNFEMMEININDERAILVKAAVINNDDEYVSFHMNGSGNSACSGSVLKLRGAVDIKKVPAINFMKEVEKYKPDLIKIDIESGEYDLFEDYELPEYVKEIAIELHGMRKATNILMYELFDKFAETWEVVHKDVQIVFGNPSIICAHFRRK